MRDTLQKQNCFKNTWHDNIFAVIVMFTHINKQILKLFFLTKYNIFSFS